MTEELLHPVDWLPGLEGAGSCTMPEIMRSELPTEPGFLTELSDHPIGTEPVDTTEQRPGRVLLEELGKHPSSGRRERYEIGTPTLRDHREHPVPGLLTDALGSNGESLRHSEPGEQTESHEPTVPEVSL